MCETHKAALVMRNALLSQERDSSARGIRGKKATIYYTEVGFPTCDCGFSYCQSYSFSIHKAASRDRRCFGFL